MGFVLFALSAYTAKPQNPDQITDAVIVFTGDQDRVETGLDLFAHGKTAHLYISGVYADVTKDEIISKWRGDIALPPCCITLDYTSQNTVQNAQETQNWVRKQDYRLVRLVTSDYHMNRSLIELQHRLPDVKILAYPVKHLNFGKDYREKPWKVLFLEYHKALYRYLVLLFQDRPSVEHKNHK